MSRLRLGIQSLALISAITLSATSPRLLAQESKKGELGDFTEDYDDEESGSDEGAQFVIVAILENIGEISKLWGHTAGTQFGPYPSYPYAGGDGFLTSTNAFRSYFFNTEFSYHHLNSDLRSYIVKWETQFAHRSKLSFDLAVYEEDIPTVRSVVHDHLTFYGLRYGYAVFRSEKILLNLEGGFRGFHRRGSHGGAELALDFQFFPKKPLVIETELAAAYVTNGPLYTVETSAGVMIGRLEILGGMRLMKNKSADLLDGFRVGLRVWY